MSQTSSPGPLVNPHDVAVLGWMHEIAPFGVFTTDRDLNLRSWNEWLETHSGLAAPQLIGKSIFQLFPDLPARKIDEHFRRALAGEIIVLSSAFHTYLLPLASTVRESGFEYMRQTARLAPLSLDGQICGTIAIIEDVTQRETQSAGLVRRHERDQLLSACLGHLLSARDPDNLTQELFPKLSQFIDLDTYLGFRLEPDGKFMRLHFSSGLPEGETSSLALLPVSDPLFHNIASTCQQVVANSLATCTSPFAQRLLKIGLRSAVLQPLQVAGRVIGYAIFGSRKTDRLSPEETELICTVSNYAAVALDRGLNEVALRKAKEDLSQYAVALESKVLERTARLQDTIVQLESFSYTVAHDLRAPIRALRGYAEVLLEDASNHFSDDSRHYLQRISRAANRLEALTRDLLQFSTVSRQDVQLASIDLLELVNDLCVLRPTLKPDVLTIGEPLHNVLAHRTFLQQCLSNLIDNALKFVSPGSKPRITIWTELIEPSSAPVDPALAKAFNPAAPSPHHPPPSVASAKSRVRIWVEDNGIGIAPESREKIFGIFERLYTSEKYEGTGIGLAIVARAMQRMNGNCGVDSNTTQGSRFWLDLAPAPA